MTRRDLLKHAAGAAALASANQLFAQTPEAARLRDSFDSVSYTHLDVYKRQIFF